MFQRPVFKKIISRIEEPRRFLQLLWGPRQVGKTTVMEQICATWPHPYLMVSGDDCTDSAWLSAQWNRARLLVEGSNEALLIVDEVQKIPRWSEIVKSLWDKDSAQKISLKVVLLGSSPLLVTKGSNESLAGRFEVVEATHWLYSEMHEAFGFRVDEFIYFGGYPGAVFSKNDYERFVDYVRNALIAPTIEKDILLASRIDKPALLRQTFLLACEYAGQILSYNKMLGQLQDAGNTTTIAHYLQLLQGAGLIVCLPRYSGEKLKKRASSPKLIVQNSALASALSGVSFAEARAQGELWGRLVENTVGAHLYSAASFAHFEVQYWNESNAEVDFVIQKADKILAIEVKSGRKRRSVSGLERFLKLHPEAASLIVGTGGMPLEDFLTLDPHRLL